MTAQVNKWTWRKYGGFGLTILLGMALQAGCKTTSSSRSGISSIQPVDSRPAAVSASSKSLSAQAVDMSGSGVIPASYTQPWTEPASGGECSH